jgi:hypothetical protein
MWLSWQHTSYHVALSYLSYSLLPTRKKGIMWFPFIIIVPGAVVTIHYWIKITFSFQIKVSTAENTKIERERDLVTSVLLWQPRNVCLGALTNCTKFHLSIRWIASEILDFLLFAAILSTTSDVITQLYKMPADNRWERDELCSE